MRKAHKTILNNYILENKGSNDIHYISGRYGFSYNSSLDYISVYKIEKSEKQGYYYINNYPYELKNEEAEGYEIQDYFFQGAENYKYILGKNFLNNSIDTQFKKIRSYFKELYY